MGRKILLELELEQLLCIKFFLEAADVGHFPGTLRVINDAVECAAAEAAAEAFERAAAELAACPDVQPQPYSDHGPRRW
jgi:hypothetical protein